MINANSRDVEFRLGAGTAGNCFCCGRPVNANEKNTQWIEHTTSGLMIPAGVEVPTEGSDQGDFKGHQSQGCWPVGPECAKKPNIKPFVVSHEFTTTPTPDPLDVPPGYRPVKGNHALANLPISKLFIPGWPDGKDPSPKDLDELEQATEQAVLDGKTVVVDPSLPVAVWHRIGVVPLRWGAPRIILWSRNWHGQQVSKAIHQDEEPVRAWRLWRYKWDDHTDLLARPLIKNRSKP